MSRFARAEAALGHIVTLDGPAFSRTADSFVGRVTLTPSIAEQHIGTELLQGHLTLAGSFVEEYTSSLLIVTGSFDDPHPRGSDSSSPAELGFAGNLAGRVASGPRQRVFANHPKGQL